MERIPRIERLDEPKTMVFNRRESERFAVIGLVDAARTDLVAPERERRLSLTLIDESEAGVGARTDTPVPPGTSVRLRIGPLSASWRHGRVVRCVPMGQGYRVGIAFDSARAA